MPNTITWNGVSSDTLGLSVERYPALNRPMRKFTVADVPGQNGSAYILQNAWSETVQAYEISAKNPTASFKEIAEWLHSADDYAVLMDSYDPSIYRMAVVVDAFDVENSLNRAGRALIQFRCRPERYIVTSDEEVTSTKTISNTTAHVAQPLIKIEGQGYPSMLPTTDRNEVSDDVYPSSQYVPSLTASKIRYTYLGMKATKVGNNWKIENGSGFISSHSETEGTVAVSVSNNLYVEHGIGMNRSIKPNTDYTISFITNAASIVTVLITDKNGWIRNGSQKEFSSSASRQSMTFTTSNNAYWAVVVFAKKTTGSITFSDIQFNLGDTAQPYAPYVANTASEFKIGDTVINLSELYDYMYLDCETMNAYRGNGENCNPLLTVTDEYGNMTPNFPRLVPGNNAIEITAGGWITKLTITPRFWTL